MMRHDPFNPVMMLGALKDQPRLSMFPAKEKILLKHHLILKKNLNRHRHSRHGQRRKRRGSRSSKMNKLQCDEELRSFSQKNKIAEKHTVNKDFAITLLSQGHGYSNNFSSVWLS